jgi:hypothetical protein
MTLRALNLSTGRGCFKPAPRAVIPGSGVLLLVALLGAIAGFVLAETTGVMEVLWPKVDTRPAALGTLAQHDSADGWPAAAHLFRSVAA